MPQTGTSGLSWKTGTGIVAVVAVMAVIACLAYVSHKSHKEAHVLQTQQQLLMTAGLIALGIEAFIDDYSDNLKTMSRNPRVQEKAYKGILVKKPPTKHSVCCDLYEIHQDRVDAFTVLDANGIMLLRLPHIEERIGRDHTDKPGVAYVLREHKAHVREVFYNNLGSLAISILEPVFYNDEFVGMVRWMIQLDTISKYCIEPVKVGNKGYVWMFDNKQLIISHPQKDLVGVSMLDALKKIHTESGETFDESGLKEHIRENHDYLNRVKTEEGYGIFANCLTDEDDIVAYKRVSAGRTTWNLIITLPYSEIAGPIYKNARNIFGLAGIAILLFGAGGVMFFTNQKRKIELEAETKYLKEIAESAEALQNAHDELETRVEKRTAELAKANEKLLIEIIDRERAREALKDSLSEKEVLLREIHHRVKNNLQIISSLLDMTSMWTGNQDAIDVIAEARGRINTMALIHTLLYHSDRVDQIHMGSYVQQLVDYLSQVYGAKTGLVTSVIEPSDVYLAMRQAAPCSLVLNEVISNAFKHAFEEGQKGTIRISLQRLPNDRIFIRVKDDGIGIPEGIEIDKVESLGLRLTRNLVQEQLMGEITFNRDMGTDIVIEFQLLKEENDNA